MNETLDLRIQKTYMALTSSMIEMMETMPLENIKVKDLCERAMIRKSTFYKHFADKYELLEFIIKSAIDEHNAKIEVELAESTPLDYYPQIIDYIFGFVKSNEQLVRSAAKSNSLMTILEILSRQIIFDIRQRMEYDKSKGHKLPVSAKVVAAFFAGGIAENIRQWIIGDEKADETELKKQIDCIIKIIYQSSNN